MTSDAIGAALREALGESVRGEGDSLRVVAKSVADVSALFRAAAKLGARVSVPGSGIAPASGVVALDLDGLARVCGLDVPSRTLHVEGGATLGAVEARLHGDGLTLGTSGTAAFQRESIASWLARGAPGARAHADDPVDQLVAGLDVVIADGTPIVIRPAPRRAVGPDLVPSFVGGRGCLGAIVGAHLVARSVVAHANVAYRFPTREAAESARAWVRGRGVRPACTALASGDDGQAYLSVRVEGRKAVRDASLATVARIASERGGHACDADAVPAAPSTEAAPPSDVVRALGRALDAAGILRT